jgi:hypothetical protein
MTIRTNVEISYAFWQMKIQNQSIICGFLEVMEDDERPRADIQALNTGLSFPPINTVRLNLEVI